MFRKKESQGKLTTVSRVGSSGPNARQERGKGKQKGRLFSLHPKGGLKGYGRNVWCVLNSVFLLERKVVRSRGDLAVRKIVNLSPVR